MEQLISVDNAIDSLESTFGGIKMLDDDIFSYKLKDGSKLIFYINREKRSIIAHFPYIFLAKDGTHYRFTKQRDYTTELKTLDMWAAFVMGTVLECQHGTYDHLIIH